MTINPSHTLSARAVLSDVAALLLPVACAGCSLPDRTLCLSCRRQIHCGEITVSRLSGSGSDSISVFSALSYERTVRRVLLAYKDQGRIDVANVLALALRPAIRAALAASAQPPHQYHTVIPVVIPTSRAAWRRRGYHPTGQVLAKTGIIRPPLWKAVRWSYQSATQRGLSRSDRALNRAETMVASPRLSGRSCLIIDDVLTTGATVNEARRAISAAGGIVVGAATLAKTPLSFDSHSVPGALR